MLYIATLFIFLFFSLLLCMIVLAQESKATGMGAAFGAETTSSLFGGSSAQILQKITGWSALVFLSLCLFFSAWTSSWSKPTSLTPAVKPAKVASLVISESKGSVA